MSWLDGLSAALTAGTQGAAGWLEGQQRGQKEAEERARQMAAALRQQHIDEQNRLMQQAQIGHLGAQTDALRNPPETWGDFEDVMNPETGQLERVQRSNRGGVRVAGLTPPPPGRWEGSEGWKAAEKYKASLRPRQQSAGEAAREMREQEQESIGAAYLQQNPRDPELAVALQGIYARTPALAKRPGLAAYYAMQSRKGVAGVENTEASANAKSGKGSGRGFSSPPPGMGTSGTAPTAPTQTFPRPAGWSDEKWNAYLRDTGQAK